MCCKTAGFILMNLVILQTQAFADLPGNKGRSNVSADFKNVASLGDYQLFIVDEDSVIGLNKDTLYIISGSRGKPHQVIVFAAKGAQKTDSIFLNEYEQENFMISFSGVVNNKLLYDMTAVKINSGDSVFAAAAPPKISLTGNWSKTTEILLGCATSAILGLIVVFIWRKRSSRKKPIDSVL
ncbi:MAG TPA: hypothetical protein PL045_01720 [Chitinophagaceae bacterium]|nr:hypothetical protein [Chitinophagaceae bacterium]